MSGEKQGFPDKRDEELIAQAEEVRNLAEDLLDWASTHTEARANGHFPIREAEQINLLRWTRRARSLEHSANAPVAAAVYGASQTGKSLFIGRVLEPADSQDSPLGKSEKDPEPTYVRNLSFTHDINPQSGSNEATALVTRFTTFERFDAEALREFPIKVRALSRSEWLRVLFRGHRSECKQRKGIVWGEGQVRELFEQVHDQFGAERVDREWRMDLIDLYTYGRNLDPRTYALDESMFNGFLNRYPLSDAGCLEIAGHMFWNREEFPELTNLFNEVWQFIQNIKQHGRDGILIHWAVARFLLDSQRTKVQESPNSEWLKEVSWDDVTEDFRDGWYVLDYKGTGRRPSVDMAVIQSAMLEMILPVIPHRLNEDWQSVLHKVDVLDLPGMVASGSSDTEGGAHSIETLADKMNVVKRGKVFYLIDRYIDERQMQTMLLQVRGGNLHVSKLMKEYVDRWGRSRYGEENWPRRVRVDHPALFIGMTGIDEEFKDSHVNRTLYDNRLENLSVTCLREVLTDFGGPGRPFTNVYPIRYPGTWDANAEKRALLGAEKWDTAGQVFVDSELVKRFVADPAGKWEIAMRDHDGGLSLIADGFLKATTARQKQDALGQQLKQLHEDLRKLAESWHCDPDSNQDREKRIEVANKVLSWLADEENVYERVFAVETALCFDEGSVMSLAEMADQKLDRARLRPESMEKRFPRFLDEFLNDWAKDDAPARWRTHTEGNEHGGPWLAMEDFSAFTRFLGEYLCSKDVFADLSEQLLKVIQLRIHDEGTRRYAQREYVRLVLNDYVTNPGPSAEAIDTTGDTNGQDFGLMAAFIDRWRGRLAAALASAAGEHREIPAGNDELYEILNGG